MGSKRSGPGNFNTSFSGYQKNVRKTAKEAGVDERTRLELEGMLANEEAYFERKFAGPRGFLNITKDTKLKNYSSSGRSAIDRLLGEITSGTSDKIKARVATQKLYETMVDTPDSQRLRGLIADQGSLLRK